jgi:hypothetical protein
VAPSVRRILRALVLLTAAGWALPLHGARAQDGSADGRDSGAQWRLAGLRKGFCIQWLLNPDSLRRNLPREVRLLPAEGDADLHPALRQVVANQPEYRSWSPSALCFFRLGGVVAGSRSIGNPADSAKAIVLGIWTVAAETGRSGPRNLALELRANDGDLRDAGSHAGLEVDRLAMTVGPVPRDDGPPRPEETRYQIRLGKTLLVWDGRAGQDTTRTTGPIAWGWQAPSPKGGWRSGALTLGPTSATIMIGSLRVEGKDPLARALQASPIRYVGPAYEGGEGELRIE